MSKVKKAGIFRVMRMFWIRRVPHTENWPLISALPSFHWLQPGTWTSGIKTYFPASLLGSALNGRQKGTLTREGGLVWNPPPDLSC